MSVFGRKRAGMGDGAGASLALNLTALMDILSNLLFFLLASYTSQSVEVESGGLKLPSSKSQLSLNPLLTVTVADNRIEVSGVPVAKIERGAFVGELDGDGNIAPLYERLHSVKTSREAAGRADIADADLILLLADRATDSKTITQVLKTAGHAGFYSVKFGVISE